MTTTEFHELVELARPIDDGDSGSPRQVYLENMVWTELITHLSPTQYDELEVWCSHAGTDERLNRALSLWDSMGIE